MGLQILMKRDLLSLNAKLDLIGSNLAPLSKQLDQFTAKLCVSALLLFQSRSLRPRQCQMMSL